MKRAKSEERKDREYSVARKGSVKREEMCDNERRVRESRERERSEKKSKEGRAKKKE